MQIGNVKIWIERSEVDGNLTYTMGSIDQAKDILLLTDLGELLERVEDAGHAHD